MKKIILIALFILQLTTTIFSQLQEITVEESNTPLIKTPITDERYDKPAIIKLMGSNKLQLNNSPISNEAIVVELNKLMSTKLPFEEIIYISADGDTKYSEIVEAIKLGRKSDIDDFGLLLNNQNVEIRLM